MQQRVQAVLDFWFGSPPATVTADPEHMALWFGGNADHDRAVTERFGKDHEAAVAGRVDSWTECDKGLAALIIVLDQFSRVIHRDTARAFAADDKAAGLVEEAIRTGRDRFLTPLERVFLYMPLEHSENPARQKLSVSRFRALCDEIAPSHRKQYRDFLVYAEKHCEVIRRFGRFPHRNPVLGRTDTAEEKDFLRHFGRGF